MSKRRKRQIAERDKERHLKEMEKMEYWAYVRELPEGNWRQNKNDPINLARTKIIQMRRTEIEETLKTADLFEYYKYHCDNYDGWTFVIQSEFQKEIEQFMKANGVEIQLAWKMF